VLLPILIDANDTIVLRAYKTTQTPVSSSAIVAAGVPRPLIDVRTKKEKPNKCEDGTMMCMLYSDLRRE
jgi:hypothetical protein